MDNTEQSKRVGDYYKTEARMRDTELKRRKE